jgi:hypothetical protein
LTGIDTCSTKFKLVDVIKLIGCYVTTDEGIDLVLIENNSGLIATLNLLLHQIFHNGNHNILTPLDV